MNLRKLARNLMPVRRDARKQKKGTAIPSISRTAPAEFYLAVVTMVKNEGEHLKEWITFHRLVGCDHIFIYDNGSSDSTAEVLRPFVAEGFVTLMPWPEFFPWRPRAGIDSREAAFAHSICSFGAKCRWMMFIDVDEFVFPAHADSLRQPLSAYEDLPAIALPWHMFGHSGHVSKPPGLVTESYTMRARLPVIEPLLAKYKSIADPVRIRMARHHRFIVDEGRLTYTQGRQILKDPNWGYLEPDPTDSIILNHYYTRSVEQFERKIRRPSAGGLSRADNRRLRRDAIESSAVEDLRIQRFVPALRNAMGLD